MAKLCIHCIVHIFSKRKTDREKTCVCEIRMPPAATKTKLTIFSTEVKFGRSLTLVSFERVSLIECACQNTEMLNYF